MLPSTLFLLAAFSITLLLTAGATEAQTTECTVLLQTTETEQLPELVSLTNWHRVNRCGKDIAIALITAQSPKVDSLNDLIEANLFEEAEDQRRLFPDACRQDADRVTNLVETAHRAAPGAFIYVYCVGDARAATYTSAVNNIRNATQGFRHTIIVNAVAVPWFPRDEVEPVYELMKSLTSEGVLWLNASGNFGNSYYEGSGFSGRIQLQVIPERPDMPFAAAIVWENANAEFQLDASLESERYEPVPQATVTGPSDRDFFRTYQIINIGPGITEPVYIGVTRAPGSGNSPFQVYLLDATLDPDIPRSGGSIPPPNDFATTLTIGALPHNVATQPLISSSNISEGKPEIIASGSLDNEGRFYGSAFAATLVAGVAATYWSESSLTLADLTDWLRNETQLLVILPAPGTPHPIILSLGEWLSSYWPHVVIFIIIIFALLTLVELRYRRPALERWKVARLFAIDTTAECVLSSADTLVFTVRPPYSHQYPTVRRYFDDLRVHVVITPKLASPISREDLKSEMLGWVAVNEQSKSHGCSISIPHKLLDFISGHRDTTLTRGTTSPVITDFDNPSSKITSNVRFRIRIKHLLENLESDKYLKWELQNVQWENTASFQTVHLLMKLGDWPFIMYSNVFRFEMSEKEEPEQATKAVALDPTPVLPITNDVTNTTANPSTSKSTAPSQQTSKVTSEQTIRKRKKTSTRASRDNVKRLFVSYSHRDKDIVVEYCEQLEQKAPWLDIWRDEEDIEPAARVWTDEVEKGLQKSDAMLLFVSPDSMTSEWVKREVIVFDATKKPIYVLIHREAPLPLTLSSVQRLGTLSGDKQEIAASQEKIISGLARLP